MIMTYVKAWQWRCARRNADVCDIHCKDGPQVDVMGKNRVAKRKTIQKT
jgi:hypothetical protein